MRLARVVGTVVATRKHRALEGAKLLLTRWGPATGTWYCWCLRGVQPGLR